MGLRDPREPHAIVDALSVLVRDARSLPFTRQKLARIQRLDADTLIDELRASLPAWVKRRRWERLQARPDAADEPMGAVHGMLDALDAVDDLVHHATEIPLTTEVAVDRQRVADLVEELRSSIEAIEADLRV